MSKGHYRINVTTERRNLIEDAVVMLASLDERKHPDYADLVEFNLAMALESSGDFVKALAVYSDLITKEAYVGVDLSLIIFRAAGKPPLKLLHTTQNLDFLVVVILLHLGRDAQAIDYLDFIQEDAPIKSGYGRAHVLALLYIVYESRGRKFAHMLEAVNTAFQHIREDEMPFLLDYADRNRPNSSEATSVHRFITFSTAKIWEALALQAMSKGDYVYAIEMLKQVSNTQ